MDENNEGVKLLLSYNMNADNAQEYYQFVLGRYIPAMQLLGLEMSEAWHTAYGDYPDRLIGFVSEDRRVIDQMLVSDTWHELNDQLLDYVSDFSYKVVRYAIGFQI